MSYAEQVLADERAAEERKQLRAEVERLKAQIANWERKESARGSHCSDMEERALKAEAERDEARKMVEIRTKQLETFIEDNERLTSSLRVAEQTLADTRADAERYADKWKEADRLQREQSELWQQRGQELSDALASTIKSLRVAEEKLGRHEQCVRECIDALEKAGFDAHSLPELVYRVIEAKRVAEEQRERMRAVWNKALDHASRWFAARGLHPKWEEVFGVDEATLEGLTPPASPEPEGAERKPCLVNGCDKLVPHGYCWRHRNQQPGFADKVAAEMERLKAEDEAERRDCPQPVEPALRPCTCPRPENLDPYCPAHGSLRP